MSPPKRRKRPGQGAPETQPNNNAAANKPKRAGAQALVADPRFRRRMERFWPLGPRITAELLARLAAEHDCRAEVERFLDAAVENAAAIKAYGLDRWPGAAP